MQCCVALLLQVSRRRVEMLRVKVDVTHYRSPTTPKWIKRQRQEQDRDRKKKAKLPCFRVVAARGGVGEHIWLGFARSRPRGDEHNQIGRQKNRSAIGRKLAERKRKKKQSKSTQWHHFFRQTLLEFVRHRTLHIWRQVRHREKLVRYLKIINKKETRKTNRKKIPAD